MTISNVANGLRSGVCTSTTRPTAPYEGQMIYETDTNRVLVWDNAAWVMIADTDTPPGLQLIRTMSFSGLSYAAMDNCFTSDFRRYRIMVNYTSAAGDIFFRLVAGGISATGATDYTSGTIGINTNGAIGTFGSSSGTDRYYWHFVNTPSAIYSGGVLDVYNPQIAAPTMLINNSAITTGSYVGGGTHKLSNSYDGFVITNAGGGVIAGSISVYGYRD